ncbi:MAG TPA: DUF29 domain-containing protein [Cyanobacteria bacterium UBA11149]|nr:DUF29 domain-containing protein [Cyanobacteria bacterium UBA11367]HBE60333.1 DUF29 domain-containing protein [Cyanobacteria bacterium UBA11366]HBK66655.1 DUF29 domain-containing protein [Cyanobacteria bacterium UBA11166]HBR75425.1 DUF29 domain-containing protein [Cyanobacteria bacterium UBA11159]HBS71869.1 DUF29 domain-containing protein [Cyanobacteria bacterium UBA11153]HBW89689.1 DUF29 domain-containing protein [Cyanobacteria bacterium UBA11149]HCA95155.1 DUF29 domain-containing protein 
MTLTTDIKISLYEQDYQLWLEQTLNQLRNGDFDPIDLDNLIEELESLGKSDKHAISSYLMRLCEHLLKVKYWESEREACLRGWDIEITNFRIEIQKRLKTSPSLKRYLQDSFLSEYTYARKLFLKTSQLDPDLIPEEPCFTLDRALDEDWIGCDRD